MTRIEKGPQGDVAFRRSLVWFPRARDAFRSLLQEAGVTERGVVLLPGYIGWSPKEGSGVFDPVRQLSARFAFYRVDRKAQLDVEDLQTKLHRLRPRVLLLIHYFGYPDPAAREVADAARKQGCLVVEDEAHSMLSDVVGGVCGRDADAALFSLHKILPLRSGGVLVRNGQAEGDTGESNPSSVDPAAYVSLGSFDLAAMSAARVRNARFLAEQLEPLRGDIELLRPEVHAGVVPQTLPVTLTRAPRDAVYEEMNKNGYGVVSLYHTMIAELPSKKYPDAHWLSRRILNLPVHQDASIEALGAMVARLKENLAKSPGQADGAIRRRGRPDTVSATARSSKRKQDSRGRREPSPRRGADGQFAGRTCPGTGTRR